jgi:hypothetical protein
MSCFAPKKRKKKEKKKSHKEIGNVSDLAEGK